MSEMTGRERVLAALRREQPDRVPYVETQIHERVGLQLLGLPLPPHLMAGAAATVNEDELVQCGSFLESSYYPEKEIADHLEMDGHGAYLFVHLEVDQGETEGHTMVSGGRLRTRADLQRVRLPDPDDPALYDPYRQFIARHRESGRALFCFTNLASDPAILGMGLKRFATMIYDDRAFVEETLELYGRWQARAVHHLSRLGFDFLWLADDIAFKTGPFISPKLFRELLLPHYRRVAEQVTVPWIFHSDGNVGPILDDLLTLGMQGLHPLEPDAMDLAGIKRRYGDRLCLCGHISMDALGQGPPERVDTLVREAIAVAGPNGGYICGSANSIAYYLLPDNVRAMARAVKKYGRYPLA
jgi:uroporphyrinogen decarboxylase